MLLTRLLNQPRPRSCLVVYEPRRPVVIHIDDIPFVYKARPPTMRAFVVKELTHPSNISLSKDVPEPTAGPGQVLVDVYSAGLNFFEVPFFYAQFQFSSTIAIDPPSTGKTSNKSPFAIYSWIRICGQDI